MPIWLRPATKIGIRDRTLFVANGCRSQFALSLAEREEISRRVMTGKLIRSIALQLDRAPWTISREIKRNGGQGSYRALRPTRRHGRPKQQQAGSEPILGPRRGWQAQVPVGTPANCKMAKHT